MKVLISTFLNRQKSVFFLLFLMSNAAVNARNPVDTIPVLEPVQVEAFGIKQKSTASVKTAAYQPLLNPSNSIVNAVNIIPGVRMEERSPGSYRVNLRGSSLRSPFGVRNVKVYWNDIPMTDPNGATYLNQLVYNNYNSIQVIKGPVSSMYGVATGGLMLIDNLNKTAPRMQLQTDAGSFGYWQTGIALQHNGQRSLAKLTYNHQQSDGYREHTRLRKDNVSWQQQWQLAPKHRLATALLASSMYYQTPGALTEAEYSVNARQSRPAAGAFPSSKEAKAAIWQKNILAGVSWQYQFREKWLYSLTTFGNATELQNAAVRNFEKRVEPFYGIRTMVTYQEQWNKVSLKWITGTEWSKGNYRINVSENQQGLPGEKQTADKVNNRLHTLFTQANWELPGQWSLYTGISLSGNKVNINRNFPDNEIHHINWQNILTPRVLIKKEFSDYLSAAASLSRGFSPPTIGEIIPSTGVISSNLEPEKGTSYELEITGKSLDNKLRVDITAFYFPLHNGLVQQRDSSGADYFVNAGNIKQKGIELGAQYSTIPNGSVLKIWNIRTGLSFHHLRYGNYLHAGENFKNKQLPGSPQYSAVVNTYAGFARGFSAILYYYMASSIYLNNANTAKATAYHLLNLQLAWEKKAGKHAVRFYVLADNLLNQEYSLGNDINAAAARYFNAAPGLNFMAGIQWSIL